MTEWRFRARQATRMASLDDDHLVSLLFHVPGIRWKEIWVQDPATSSAGWTTKICLRGGETEHKSIGGGPRPGVLRLETPIGPRIL